MRLFVLLSRNILTIQDEYGGFVVHCLLLSEDANANVMDHGEISSNDAGEGIYFILFLL